jgi:TPR repeat protein
MIILWYWSAKKGDPNKNLFGETPTNFNMEKMVFNMKMLKNLRVLLLSSFILTNVFANITDTPQSDKSLGNQYLEQAKKACNEKNCSNVNVLSWLKTSAKYDNAEANFVLGLNYFLPESKIPGVKANMDLAMEYMTHADQLGDPEAKKMLVIFQLQGFGNTSPDKILKLRSEIENRVLTQTPGAQKIDDLFNLLSSYQSVKQKELRSIDKTEYYANQLVNLQLNNLQKKILSNSCMMISLHYMWGMDGNKIDPQKSFKWTKVATDLGLKEAYYSLSDMYFYGYGTPVNFSKSYEMTKLGDQLSWATANHDHKKHVYPLFYRIYVYLLLPKLNQK